LAYAIGLISSDGNLSSDGRHISLVSKDLEMINNFQKCLKIDNKIGKNYSDVSGKRKYQHKVQFGDVLFYKFLISIGLMPKKSKILGELKIPKEYFFDFLRGSFDGDGSFYSYWDKRWRSSFLFYLEFVSASKTHIDWLRKHIRDNLKVNGHLSGDGKKTTFQLKYAKKEAVEIIRKMYYNTNIICLKRKKNKIFKALNINKKQQKIYYFDK
jgi:hypothetical protein